jgi:hypothetical protein
LDEEKNGFEIDREVLPFFDTLGAKMFMPYFPRPTNRFRDFTPKDIWPKDI